MDSEYEFTEVNKCDDSNNNITVIASNSNTKNIDNIQKQHDENVHLDTINEENIKPLYGGNKYNTYIIQCNKKIYKIYSENMNLAVKEFINKKKFKNDYLLKIYDKHKEIFYIILSKKNKYKKL